MEETGRITGRNLDLFKIAVEGGEIIGEVSGKFRHECHSKKDYPAVGDYVLVDNGIIRQVLKRKSLIVRKAPGSAHEIQVIAANVDIIFICMSLNKDYSPRRLERYLAMAYDSGAVPVVLLTKKDLCSDVEEYLADTMKIAPGTEVLAISSLNEEGIIEVRSYIKKDITVAFVGSSGAGKTTLINKLLLREDLVTREIRRDDKGRHATTGRELYLLPEGGALIDTPGMRELGLEDRNLEKAFPEIEALAASCRFKNCSHENEPGCAVRQAIEEGSLDQERLSSWKKLLKEERYQDFDSREIEKVKIKEMFKDFGGIKNARDFVKKKNKRNK